MPRRMSKGEVRAASPAADPFGLHAPLAEAAGLYAWSLLADGSTVQLSPGLRALLACDADQMVLADFLRRLSAPEDLAAVKRAMAVAKAGSVAQLDHQGPTQNDQILVLRTTLAPADGASVMVQGLSLNISPILASPEVDRRRLQGLVGSTTAALNCIAAFDRKGRYLAASSVWQRRFDLEPGAYVGKTFAEVSPDLPDQTRKLHRKAARGQHLVGEEELKPRGSDPVLLKTEYRPILGVSEDTIAYTVRAIQVHKDEQAWRQAQAYSERLEVALESARAGVFEMDMAARTFWCSREFAELVGHEMTQDEAFSPCWPFHHPDDRAYIMSTMVDAIQKKADAHLEARAMLPSGEVRWIDWRMKVKTDVNGERTRVVGFAIDITTRKRQELALSEARADAQTNAERLRIALSAARAGAFELNLEDQTFWSSSKFDEIVGRRMSYDEACLPTWPMNAPEDLERMREFLPSIESGDMPPVEWRVVLPSGERRWVRSFALLSRGEDGVLQRVVGAILDIDDRKRQELALMEAERAAHAAAEAKAEFLTNMSHEIRTPMNGILGVLHLLKSEALSPDGEHLLGEAQACGQMLAQLLNDVIDFSKIEEGRLELQPEPIDPADVLNSVARLLRPQAEAKGLELTTQIEGDGGWIMADPVRLRQALFNLIGNAVKFTVEGKVQARLYLRNQGRGRRLRFEIEDTGVGIPAAAQPSLFRRFQQADGSTARRFGGSGLGLAITRALADLMGGEVGFTSREGEGSTFWIEVLADKATGPDLSLQAVDGVLDGLKILIVEDNPTNRLVATKMLEALGAEIDTANDGVEGVEAVQGGTPYDLVLMDVQMPRMDGIEATRTIRALPAPLGAMPIIGLTANALSHQWAEYRAAGMDGVAAKPISPPALIAEISRVMTETRATLAA